MCYGGKRSWFFNACPAVRDLKVPGKHIILYRAWEQHIHKYTCAPAVSYLPRPPVSFLPFNRKAERWSFKLQLESVAHLVTRSIFTKRNCFSWCLTLSLGNSFMLQRSFQSRYSQFLKHKQIHFLLIYCINRKNNYSTKCNTALAFP